MSTSILIKIVADHEFFVLDLDNDIDGAGRTFGEFPVTPESCAASALKWCNKKSDFAYFDWAFRQRFEVRLDDAAARLPASGMAEDETVGKILAAFTAGSDGVRRRIDFFSGNFLRPTADRAR